MWILCFKDANEKSPLNEESMHLLRHFLIEFVVRYRTKTSEEVTPNSMKSYVLGVQSSFKECGYIVELTAGPIFADPKEGLLSVLNNLFSEQQAQGMLVKSDNSLSLDDVRKILASPLTCTKTSTGF